MSIEDFDEWLDQNKEEVLGIMGASTRPKTIGQWLKQYGATLALVAQESAPDDKYIEVEWFAGGGIFGADDDGEGP
jgi:hypothetical protein